MAATHLELAAAGKALLGHDPAETQAAGLSETELRRYARRPRQPAQRTPGRHELPGCTTEL